MVRQNREQVIAIEILPNRTDAHCIWLKDMKTSLESNETVGYRLERAF